MIIKNLRYDVVLAPFTTYGIGGPADYFVEAKNLDELVEAVLWARQQSVDCFILGKGSNILVGDKGFRGLVILNSAKGTTQKGSMLTADSGADIGQLIDMAASAGLSGLEHYAGIPSSVGGAIWQNLHFLSPDRSRTVFIAEIFHSATVLMPDNSIMEVGADFFEFGYDDSILHHQKIVVLSATFVLQPEEKGIIADRIAANLSWRRQRQPPVEQFPSCGSVFKQINGVGAGRLIDEAGLKGMKVGGAQISPLHANFIVNTGGATAEDVLELAAVAQQTVRKKLGYELEMEINLVGDF